MDRQEKKGGRSTKRHNAPPGYYTAQEAQHLLRMSSARFHRNVGDQGLHIRRYVPYGAKEGFYSRQEIDLLATLRDSGIVAHSKLPPTTFRQATAQDAQGVVDVLLSLGWRTTTAELRKEWYAVNSQIDHIVLQGDTIMGYLSAVPYTDEAMHKRLYGEIEAAGIRPEDILPFEDGKTYDLFVGLAERKKPQKKPGQYARYGLRLVLGFRHFLTDDLYKRGIRIRKLLAHSAEPDGQALAAALGFERERTGAGRYPIYELDMQTSQEPWVKRYRELWT